MRDGLRILAALLSHVPTCASLTQHFHTFSSEGLGKKPQSISTVKCYSLIRQRPLQNDTENWRVPVDEDPEETDEATKQHVPPTRALESVCVCVPCARQPPPGRPPSWVVPLSW